MLQATVIFCDILQGIQHNTQKQRPIFVVPINSRPTPRALIDTRLATRCILTVFETAVQQQDGEGSSYPVFAICIWLLAG